MDLIKLTPSRGRPSGVHVKDPPVYPSSEHKFKMSRIPIRTSSPSKQCALPMALYVWTVQVPTVTRSFSGCHWSVQKSGRSGETSRRASMQSARIGEVEGSMGVQVSPDGGNSGGSICVVWGNAAASASAVMYSWSVSNCSQCLLESACAVHTLGHQEGCTDESEE